MHRPVAGHFACYRCVVDGIHAQCELAILAIKHEDSKPRYRIVGPGQPKYASVQVMRRRHPSGRRTFRNLPRHVSFASRSHATDQPLLQQATKAAAHAHFLIPCGLPVGRAHAARQHDFSSQILRRDRLLGLAQGDKDKTFRLGSVCRLRREHLFEFLESRVTSFLNRANDPGIQVAAKIEALVAK